MLSMIQALRSPLSWRTAESSQSESDDQPMTNGVHEKGMGQRLASPEVCRLIAVEVEGHIPIDGINSRKYDVGVGMQRTERAHFPAQPPRT